MTSSDEKINLLVKWLFRTDFVLKNEIIDYENAHQFSTNSCDVLELYKRNCTLHAFRRFEHDINIILFDRW